MTVTLCRRMLTATLATVAFGTLLAGEYKSGTQWTEPPVVEPGGPEMPPSDAIVLFDGSDFSAWNDAQNFAIEDGIAVP